jgi:hypothetical protein
LAVERLHQTIIVHMAGQMDSLQVYLRPQRLNRTLSPVRLTPSCFA